jgi:hypothetical protein
MRNRIYRRLIRLAGRVAPAAHRRDQAAQQRARRCERFVEDLIYEMNNQDVWSGGDVCQFVADYAPKDLEVRLETE